MFSKLTRFGFVSGHDFSRAARGLKTVPGFQPLRSFLGQVAQLEGRNCFRTWYFVRVLPQQRLKSLRENSLFEGYGLRGWKRIAGYSTESVPKGRDNL